MSRATGQAITFVNESDEQALAWRSNSGAADWEIRGWISSYWAIRDGSFATISDDVT